MKRDRFFLGMCSFVFFLFLSSMGYAEQWAKTYGGMDSDRAWPIQRTTDGGYIVAGDSFSFSAGSRDIWVLKLDGSGNITWQKTYGGTDTEYALSIKQTSDGGYILAGETFSFGAGSRDIWVLKLDGSGNITWQKTYGGIDRDYANFIQQTTDGGYIVAGETYSFGAGNADIWVLKLNASGNVTWQKTYGGGWGDYSFSAQQTTDGGYIVAGETFSFGAVYNDVLVLKLDGSGNVTWQKTYGGTDWDYTNSIQQTSDGGYIVAGETYSFGAGSRDIWVLKLNASGNIAWQKTYGGTDTDYANSIQQTSDGGYIMVGDTFSFGAGSADIWVLKLNASGNITWQKTYGGTDWEYAYSIQQTSDGGYIVAGQTNSFGAGHYDAWVLKLDTNGNIPDCSAVGTSNATVTNTSVSGVNRSVSAASTSVTGSNTTVTPASSSASTTEVCYHGCSVSFLDVPLIYWAEDAICKIYEAGIATGCSQDPLMYCPEDTVIRTQMAVFLERAIHGSGYAPPPAAGIFADVPISYWAVDWIEQLYNDGITSGCSTSPLLYCPLNPITRAQMAIFLLRSKHGSGYTPPPAAGIFADVPLSYWAVDWIEQLYNEGITTGCATSPLRYCPENSVKRSQMAVFIVRTFGL